MQITAMSIVSDGRLSVSLATKVGHMEKLLRKCTPAMRVPRDAEIKAVVC